MFPAALDFADFDLGAPTVLRVLERWPTARELATVSREELVAFARAGHNSQAERFADKVLDALSVDHFEAPAHLVRAKVDTIRLTAAQLLLLNAQRRAWERRMGELLVGTSRQRRERGTAKRDGQEPPFRGGDI